MTALHEADDLSLHEFLDQEDYWLGRDGWIDINDMDVVHRRNAAVFLLRKSTSLATVTLAFEYTEYDHITARDVWARIGAPNAWVKASPLYKRLIQDGADPDEWRA